MEKCTPLQRKKKVQRAAGVPCAPNSHGPAPPLTPGCAALQHSEANLGAGVYTPRLFDASRAYSEFRNVTLLAMSRPGMPWRRGKNRSVCAK